LSFDNDGILSHSQRKCKRKNMVENLPDWRV